MALHLMTSHPSLDPDDLNFLVLPPTELISEWEKDILYSRENIDVVLLRAYQAGADAELEACCEWLSVPCPSYGRELRNARRPKPPSKEEALNELFLSFDRGYLKKNSADIIRRALESLPD